MSSSISSSSNNNSEINHDNDNDNDDAMMFITDIERKWALSIKQAVENNEDNYKEIYGELCDMEYIAHAIIAKNKIHKALKRIRRLKCYKDKFHIQDTPEEGCAVIEQFLKLSNGFILSFGPMQMQQQQQQVQVQVPSSGNNGITLQEHEQEQEEKNITTTTTTTSSSIEGTGEILVVDEDSKIVDGSEHTGSTTNSSDEKTEEQEDDDHDDDDDDDYDDNNVEEEEVEGFKKEYYMLWNNYKYFIPSVFDNNNNDDVLWKAMYYMTHSMQPNINSIRNGCILIMDCNNAGMKNFSYQVEKYGAEFYQDTYPLRMKQICLLSTPKLFSFVYKLCKPFLSNKLKNVISIQDNVYNIQNKYTNQRIPNTYNTTTTSTNSNDDNDNMITIDGQFNTETDVLPTIQNAIRQRYENSIKFKL